MGACRSGGRGWDAQFAARWTHAACMGVTSEHTNSVAPSTPSPALAQRNWIEARCSHRASGAGSPSRSDLFPCGARVPQQLPFNLHSFEDVPGVAEPAAAGNSNSSRAEWRQRRGWGLQR